MAGRGRPTDRVVLNDDERRRLERLSRRRKAPPRVALRARIVLACDGGVADRQVAARFGVSAQTVAKWRKCFLQEGLEGLGDQPRSGRRPAVTETDVVKIVDKTLSPPPNGATRWTAAAMAAATGWSPSTVRRVWDRCGLRPDRLISSGLHPDLLDYGTWSVVGVFRQFDQKAIAISVDAQWSEEVPPFVWETDSQHQGGWYQPVPNETRASCAQGSPRAETLFVDFLHAVTPHGREDRVVFLMVNDVELHRAALLHQWRAGKASTCVSRVVGVEAWRADMVQLHTMLALRRPRCAAHGDNRRLAPTLERLHRAYAVWPDRHDGAQESADCRCKSQREGDSLERREIRRSFRWKWHYSKCECNGSDCPNCCLRRYWRICADVKRAWHEDVGTEPVWWFTLTYRASNRFNTKEWLVRAHRHLDNLWDRWRRRWGAVPPYLWGLEFTVAGTPHFHIMVPQQEHEDLTSLRRWLRESWSGITGGGRNRTIGSDHLIRVDKRTEAARVIRYILKCLAYPKSQRLVPPDTPRFRSWGLPLHWKPTRRTRQRDGHR